MQDIIAKVILISKGYNPHFSNHLKFIIYPIIHNHFIFQTSDLMMTCYGASRAQARFLFVLRLAIESAPM